MLSVENEMTDTVDKINAYEDMNFDLADCYRDDLYRLKSIDRLLKNELVIGIAIAMGLHEEVSHGIKEYR